MLNGTMICSIFSYYYRNFARIVGKKCYKNVKINLTMEVAMRTASPQCLVEESKKKNVPSKEKEIEETEEIQIQHMKRMFRT